MSWRLFILCTLLQGIQSTIHRDTLGVLLQETPVKAYPNDGHSAILFHMDLPDSSVPTECQLNCTDENQDVLHKLIHKAEYKLRRSINDFNDIIQGFNKIKHDKRGLVNAFGTAQKYLFGVATQEDIDKVYNHMQSLYANYNKAT